MLLDLHHVPQADVIGLCSSLRKTPSPTTVAAITAAAKTIAAAVRRGLT